MVTYWLENKTSDKRPQTRDRYRTAIKTHIIPGFGDFPLNKVTPAFLQGWVNQKTHGVLGNIFTVLNKTFRMAVQQGLIRTNPMEAVDRPKDAPKAPKALQGDEIQEFRDQIKKCGDETVIDIVDFVIATGMRAGEVLGIRWSDIDFDHDPPILHLQGQVTYSSEKGKTRQDEGKTQAATRSFHLSAVTQEILQRRWEKYNQLEMVFPSSAGTYIWYFNFRRDYNPARGKKFDWVTLRTLRKTLTSIVADELGPAKAADVAGRTDSRLTERVYYERSRKGVPISEAVDRALGVH